MKKRFVVLALLALTLLLMISSGQAACTTHNYYAWHTTKLATCTTAGTKERNCTVCGAVEKGTTPALGHNMGSWSTTKSATCTTAGSKERKCTRCSYKETQTIAKLGHSYSAWVVKKQACDPAGGYQERTCSRCKKVDSQKLTAKNHEYYQWDYTPGTCQKVGKKVRYCKHCGTPDEQPTTKNPNNHQDFGSWIEQQPACHPNGGYEQRKCKCGHVETRKLAAKNHEYYQWEYTPGTCQKVGKKVRYCKYCSTPDEQPTTKNLNNHQDFGKWIEGRAACHRDGGYEQRTCKCGYTETRDLDEKNHEYYQWEYISGNCMQVGKKVRYCIHCGEPDEQPTTTDPNEHAFTDDWQHVEGFDVHKPSKWERRCTLCHGEKEGGIETEIRNPEHNVQGLEYEYYDEGKTVKNEVMICDQCGKVVLKHYHSWVQDYAVYKNHTWVTVCEACEEGCTATKEVPTPGDVQSSINSIKQKLGNDPDGPDPDDPAIQDLIGAYANFKHGNDPSGKEFNKYIEEHPEMQKIIEKINDDLVTMDGVQITAGNLGVEGHEKDEMIDADDIYINPINFEPNTVD